MRDEPSHKPTAKPRRHRPPPVVDAAWVAEHLGEDGLLLADVRGPNAHIRGHLPGSIPLVLGSPAPVTDRAVLEELASEVGLRLRRHGVTGEERLVLYDGGDCIGACSSYAARRARRASVGGGDGRRAEVMEGELEQGVVELEKNRNELDPSSRRCRPSRSWRGGWTIPS